MARVAFISPFENAGNNYIDLQKQILRKIGFDVAPLTLGALLKPRIWRHFFHSENRLFFHWLESRPFVFPGLVQRIKGLCVCCVWLMVMRVVPARSVYVVHNHYVHDTEGWARKFSRRLLRALSRSAHMRLVHDPGATCQYDAIYLPHPLYRSATPTKNKSKNANPLFGVIGAVRPYKGIDGLLEHWPSTQALVIAGSADKCESDRLNAIIDRRHLGRCVQTDFRFLDEATLANYFDSIDVFVVPHLAQSMLVSGGFFEAIGRVPAILARRAPFTAWAAERLPGIFLFEHDNELPTLVAQIAARWHAGELRAAPHELAERLFGWESCYRSYAATVG